MADVTNFDLTGSGHDTVTTSAIVAATGTATIPYDSSKRALLYVKNADAAATAYITFKAGGGIRGALGDYIVQCAKGSEVMIDLNDTARYLNLADKDIHLELNDSNGDALAAAVLEDLTVLAINL